MAQQILNVLCRDPLWSILRRRQFAIAERRSDHIGQAVIGLFHAEDRFFIVFFAAANDAIGNIENIDVHPLDVLALQIVLALEIEDSLNRRLGCTFLRWSGKCAPYPCLANQWRKGR